MSLSPRQELLKLQKTLYRRNKALIEESIWVKEPDFDRYEREYDRSVSRYKTTSTADEMMTSVEDADIVYIGDYHTCHQSQRSFLRILKSVVKTNKKIMLGMELIHKRHQKVLKDYLFKRISEEDFLRDTGFIRHWIFDLWDNFKPIFDFVRYHHIPMYALDAAKKSASLQERDVETAKLMVKLLEKHPNRKLFVFIGDLHLAPSHLPAEVNRILKEKGLRKNGVVLYQNSESIYWNLAKKGIVDQTEVVKINDKTFCRMHTPPIVYQQSYINWLEHEEGEIDFDDAKHSFLQLVDHISKFLNIKLGKDKEDVEVFTCGDFSFLQNLKDDPNFEDEDIEIIKHQILASESYFISKKRYVYLANLSLNHAGEEASHYVKYLCSGSEEPRILVDAFYANVLHEALGFFGSKTVNHKRKCAHEKDYL
ncbi:ChaN family lipoprotein, partial [bacterium]|nr:ChaN family lipoprotein [bacterium]